MFRARIAAAVALLITLRAAPASARVLSYAPLNASDATPGIQPRASRHLLLSELTGAPPCPSCASPSHLVLYDTTGAEPPKNVLPKSGGASIVAFALFEGASGAACIFVGTDADVDGSNPQRYYRHLLSTDAGGTWKVVDLGPVAVPVIGTGDAESRDRGGPVTGPRGGAILPGTAETPFVVAATPFWVASGSTLFAIDRSGQARPLFLGAPAWVAWPTDLRLLGSDAAGTRFLVQGTPIDAGSKSGVWEVDLSANKHLRIDTSSPASPRPNHGWIRADGRAYVDLSDWAGQPRRRLVLTGDSGPTEVLSAQPGSVASPPDYKVRPAFFAVPTGDFTGAWIVQIGGAGTVLLSHHGGGAPVPVWSRAQDPPVEGLHASASGTRLLVQAERQRVPRDAGDSGWDPLLALWQPGQPAPAEFDEMLLFSGDAKRFVHLDVDALASGGGFVFDASFTPQGTSGGPSGGPGGGDLLQEWGVVRSGLAQSLLVPAAAHAQGAGGASWRTDVILRNPDTEPVQVHARLVGTAAADIAFTLAGGEIRLVPDIVAAFGLADGAGTLVLTPDPFRSIAATSRTYTAAPGGGTFGMGAPAFDTYAASSPGFPVFFAGGLAGGGFRTNLVLTDVLGSGASASLGSATAAGTPKSRDVTVPAGGRVQVDDVAGFLGIPSADAGALTLWPATGALVSGAIVIDPLTGDPSWLAPDIPTSTERTIPAIVHTTGVGGTLWRSDVFLFNPSTAPQTVFVSVKNWERPETDQTIAIALDAGESLVLEDALWSLFRRWGVARMKVVSTGGISGSDSVRAVARVYALGADGGTRGFALPPLNGFQTARPGEMLTILGAVGRAGLRTNLAFVELSRGTAVPSAAVVSVHVDVLNEHGQTVDSFDQDVPMAGGAQIADLFHARGLGDGPAAALLKVSVPPRYDQPNVAAYATLVDNVTGDATYLPPVLETP